MYLCPVLVQRVCLPVCLYVRAGNEPSRRLKFHNQGEGAHIYDTIKGLLGDFAKIRLQLQLACRGCVTRQSSFPLPSQETIPPTPYLAAELTALIGMKISTFSDPASQLHNSLE